MFQEVQLFNRLGFEGKIFIFMELCTILKMEF